MKVSLVKKAMGKRTVRFGQHAGTIADLVLVDNENQTVTVMGVDAGGNQVDISAVATVADTSSDTTKLTVADGPVPTATPPLGATTFKVTAVGPTTVAGSPVNITNVTTFTDGSVGPFGFVLPYDIVAGPVTGVVPVPGTPVPN